jgi:hypothetical protein
MSSQAEQYIYIHIHFFPSSSTWDLPYVKLHLVTGFCTCRLVSVPVLKVTVFWHEMIYHQWQNSPNNTGKNHCKIMSNGSNLPEWLSTSVLHWVLIQIRKN